MNSLDNSIFAPDDVLATLAEHSVNFIVIGGIAADVHGAGWSTFDVDIMISTTNSNLENLALALKELHAAYNLPDGRHIEPGLRRLISIPGPQLLTTKYGRLDVLKEAGGETFESLATDATTVVRGKHELHFASVQALIRMKRAANRPKDAKGIALLEAILTPS